MYEIEVWSRLTDPKDSNVNPLSVKTLDPSRTLEFKFWALSSSRSVPVSELRISEHLSWLTSCNNLTTINLRGRYISKIEGLSGLTNLTELDLSDNKQISDIRGLSDLVSLKILNLSKNAISKIEGLSELASLETLDLSFNKITRIEGLTNLTKLTNLILDHNQITEIRGLDSLISLKTLDLGRNLIDSLGGLTKLKSLEYLNLGENYVTKISGLGNLTSLKKLDLYLNQIEKIEGLSTLSNLEALNLNGNHIRKIEGLSTLASSLKILLVSGNRICLLEGLSTLLSLETLDLYLNKIESIEEGLSNLICLRKLCLSGNKIGKICGLNSLTGLEELSLSSNKIVEIEGLDELVSLKTLCLNDNSIKELRGISRLNSLELLNLRTNKITYVPNVFVYSPRLNSFDVTRNPVELFYPIIEAIFQTHIFDEMMFTGRFGETTLAVYSDPQSVHSVNVQSSIRKNIVRLLETDRLTPFRNIEMVTESILSDAVLPVTAKKALVEYSADAVNEMIALPGVRFADVLIPVWNRIVNLTRVDPEKSVEVKRVLSIEMADAECVCFTGRVSRLVNSLTGFFQDIIVEISKSDQISNIILLTKRKLSGSAIGYTRNSHVQLVTEEMTERGYAPEEIEIWTSEINE